MSPTLNESFLTVLSRSVEFSGLALSFDENRYYLNIMVVVLPVVTRVERGQPLTTYE